MNLRAIGAGVFFISTVIPLLAQTPQEISYETPGKQIGQVLQEISKIGGLTLKVSAPLSRDVLALRMSDGSLELLKAKIAEMENATWVQEPGYQLLKQSFEVSEREEKLHEASVERAFANSLLAQRQGLETQLPFDAKGAALFASKVESTLAQGPDPKAYTLALKALEPLSPSHRAVVGILAGFQPKDFASLPIRVKVTYSNEPNPAQRQLPEDASASVSRFIAEQTLWAKEAAQRRFSPPPTRGTVTSLLPAFIADQRMPSGTPSRVLVSMYRESSLGRVMVELKIASLDGQILNRASSNIQPIFDPIPISGAMLGRMIHPVVASSDALEVGGLASGVISTPEIRSALLHPEKVDPLSIAYGSTLVQMAKDENVNLIANLTDKLLDGGLRQPQYGSTQEYLTNLARRGQRCEAEGGWIAIGAQDPVADRAIRSDRASLGLYLRSAVGNSFSIEAQAASVLALPDPLESMLPAAVLGRLQNQGVGLKDVALLRFYGSLSADEKQRAIGSSGLPLTELSSPGAVAALNEIVFARSNPLVVPRNTHSELWRDPTVCLANGLSRSSVLHLSIQTEYSVFDLDRDRSPFEINQGAVSAAEVAYSQFQGNHPERFPNAAFSKEAHFQTGQLKRYLFDFEFGQSISVNGSLMSRTISNDAPKTFAELPDNFVSDVSKRLTEIQIAEASVANSAQAPSKVSSSTP